MAVIGVRRLKMAIIGLRPWNVAIIDSRHLNMAIISLRRLDLTILDCRSSNMVIVGHRLWNMFIVGSHQLDVAVIVFDCRRYGMAIIRGRFLSIVLISDHSLRCGPRWNGKFTIRPTKDQRQFPRSPSLSRWSRWDCHTGWWMQASKFDIRSHRQRKDVRGFVSAILLHFPDSGPSVPEVYDGCAGHEKKENGQGYEQRNC